MVVAIHPVDVVLDSKTENFFYFRKIKVELPANFVQPNIKVDLDLRPVYLTLAGIGGRGSLDGRITQLTGTPQVDTKLDLKADNPGPLLAMAGVGGDLGGKTGPLGVAGTLRGGADRMALDLTLAAFGGNAAIKGEVGAGQSPPSFALDISANHPDIRKLAAALTGAAPGGGPSGPFKLSTQAKGTAKKATLSNIVVEAGPFAATGLRALARFFATDLPLDARVGLRGALLVRLAIDDLLIRM